MSSSKPKDGSQLHMQDATNKLKELQSHLSNAKGKQSREDGVKLDNETADVRNQLDKVCIELNHIISAFEKLEKFEADISTPLNTLKKNVSDILSDLHEASTDSVKQVIECNLKALRGNIIKLKIQIPLHQQVSAGELVPHFQKTVASDEFYYLPDPYGAKETFESGANFAKEFHDRYWGLEERFRKRLLCFAIFPENAEIKKRLLRFWWAGEMLVPDDAKENDSVDGTLGQFVQMGFIVPVIEKGKWQEANSYKMHPLIRSFVINLAKKANFFDYDNKGKPTMDISASGKSCLVNSEGTCPWFWKNYLQPSPEQQQDQKEEQQPKSSDNKQQEQKKKKEKEQDMIRRRQENLDQLQTLFNLMTNQLPELPVELVSKMRNIGVLYLGKWESTVEPVEVENTEFLTGLKNMKKLRFFSLDGVSGISKLPKSLGNLTNLKILDLRACLNLEELPKGIGSLKKLTHLDLSECYLLDNIPKELSKLPKLKVLKGFVISKNSSCTLNNLAALSKLEKLSINVTDDEFSIDEKEAVFFKFKALQKLKIAWGTSGEGSSKSGQVKNRVDKKKQKSGTMKLLKLDLQCFPEREPPRWLVPEKLTCLERLYIRGGKLSNLGESRMVDNKNWEVKFLRLKFLTDIKTNWKQLQIQFPKLEYFEKANCPHITFCPCDASGVWMKNWS